MQQWAEIRRRVLVEGVSRRQILRETGMHWKTLRKILEHSGPPGYRQSEPRPRRKIGPYEERIRQILKEDKAMPPKQRHTAKRIFERLREEGYVGGYTAVKEAVREMEQRNREVFVPLAHPPSLKPMARATGSRTPKSASNVAEPSSPPPARIAALRRPSLRSGPRRAATCHLPA